MCLLWQKHDQYHFFFFPNNHICSYLELFFFSLRLDYEFLKVGVRPSVSQWSFPRSQYYPLHLRQFFLISVMEFLDFFSQHLINAHNSEWHWAAMDSANRELHNSREWMPREAEICHLELLKHNSAVLCPDVWDKIRDWVIFSFKWSSVETLK